MLTGCGDATTAPQSLAEYLDRLSAVTGLPLPPSPPSPRESLRIPRNPIANPPPSSQINLIEFLSLSGCELQINLGRRNTQLGRSASPSQRLLLDLEFLDLAPRCIALLRERGDMKLAGALQQVRRERQGLLALSIYQAVLKGPEWQLFWEHPTSLGDYPAGTSSLITESLSRLVELSMRWLSGDWKANNREFELLLSDLRAGDGGSLLLAHSWASSELQRATALLANAQSTAPFCPYGQPTDRSKALQRVVARFLVGAVQPWLVTLRQRRELLQPPIRKLEESLATELGSDYLEWTVARDTVLNNHKGIIRSHIAEIQATLAQCGQY